MYEELSRTHNQKYNRKMINAFWLVTLLALSAEIVGLGITAYQQPESLYDDFKNHTLVFLSSLLLVMLITELVYKRLPGFGYFFICISAAFALLAILIYTDLSGIQNLLFFVIIGSAFYFDKRKIVFASISSIVILLLLYQFFEPLRQSMTPFDLLLSVTVFLISMVLSLAVLTKGLMMMEYLESSAKEKQRLHVQSIIAERMAKLDPLTDLYNHKTFHEYMGDLVAQTSYADTPMTLAIIDIDNFKQINDTYGHWAGDAVIKEIAQCIRENIHVNDFASRFGGEEFAILFIDQSWKKSIELAEEIRKSIRNLKIPEIQEQTVTVSIGVKQYTSGMYKEDWFQSADLNLYDAKHQGKNKVVS